MVPTHIRTRSRDKITDFVQHLDDHRFQLQGPPTDERAHRAVVNHYVNAERKKQGIRLSPESMELLKQHVIRQDRTRYKYNELAKEDHEIHNERERAYIRARIETVEAICEQEGL